MAGAKGKDKIPWHEELRANVRVLGITLSAGPLYGVAFIVGAVLEGVVPAVIISQTGRFVGSLSEAVRLGEGSAAYADARSSVMWLGIAIAGSQVLKPVKGAIQFGLGRRFQALMSRKVMAGVTATPGIAHFEDPEFQDKLEVAGWIDWAPAQTVNMLAQMLHHLIQITSLVALTALYAGWVPALLLGTAIPAGIAAFNRVKSQGLAMWQDSPHMRRAGYFRTLAIELEAAKEVRVFGLKDWALDRQHGAWGQGLLETWRKRRIGAIVVMALHVLSVGSLVVAYWAILQAALAGRIDAGRFVTVSMASVQLLTSTTAIFSTVSWIRRMNYFLPHAMRLLDLARRDPRMHATGSTPARGAPKTGIRFEGVRFRYPGTERWILDGLTLDLGAGRSIALVGENGAGKTTLIKLLCRFYDPTEGRITLDGIDIREYDLADYRRRLACIFQDFVRFELPARDNVGFGAVERRDDDALLEEAAARVGVLDEIRSLPQGWETPLSRAFDGVDLSGGQWQRIALARAIMAQLGRDADILILDEPTASLDVRLEHELYEHFAELARGRTTLLVSHRFSTVRMAERIVFLEDGRVVEDGSHDELVARAGRYAELYALQAQHYLMTGVLE